MIPEACGTVQGYQAHQERAELPCGLCGEAYRADVENRRLAALREHGERRRGEILQYVQDYWVAEGYAPSLRDIMRGCGYASPSSVHYEVDLLIAEGKLARTPGIPRSIRVVG